MLRTIEIFTENSWHSVVAENNTMVRMVRGNLKTKIAGSVKLSGVEDSDDNSI